MYFYNLYVAWDGWMDGWGGGWMGGWVDGWMDGWVDGWMDGWMDAWALIKFFLDSKFHCFLYNNK